jgi:hypothetical protein
MFFRSYQGWKLEGSRSMQQRCSHCGNTCDHIVYVEPRGIQIGVIFSKKPLIGARNYYLTCSICGDPAQQLTYDQAMAMKE